jgi:hypothetical protein
LATAQSRRVRAEVNFMCCWRSAACGVAAGGRAPSALGVAII